MTEKQNIKIDDQYVYISKEYLVAFLERYKRKHAQYSHYGDCVATYYKSRIKFIEMLLNAK